MNVRYGPGNSAALLATESVVNRHYLSWKRGEPDPLTPTLDAMYARWLALLPANPLALDWLIHPLPRPAARSQSHRAGRRGRGGQSTYGAA